MQTAVIGVVLALGFIGLFVRAAEIRDVLQLVAFRLESREVAKAQADEVSEKLAEQVAVVTPKSSGPDPMKRMDRPTRRSWQQVRARLEADSLKEIQNGR